MLQPHHTIMAFGIVITAAVAGWAYADHLRGRLDAVVIERDQAIADRQAAERAMVVLADEAAAAQSRSAIRSTGRESILAMPVTEDGPVSGVLRRGMSVADEIGGLK